MCIRDSAVTTAKLADGSVTTAKLADDAVTAAKLADDAVVTANIVDANVTIAKLAADVVGASITVDDNDGIIINDGGTMKLIPASDLKTFTALSLDGLSDAKVAGTNFTGSMFIGIDNSGGTLNAAEYNLGVGTIALDAITCLLYTSPSPRDATLSRMPSSA